MAYSHWPEPRGVRTTVHAYRKDVPPFALINTRMVGNASNAMRQAAPKTKRTQEFAPLLDWIKQIAKALVLGCLINTTLNLEVSISMVVNINGVSVDASQIEMRSIYNCEIAASTVAKTAKHWLSTDSIRLIGCLEGMAYSHWPEPRGVRTTVHASRCCLLTE